jgi:hypothetical protein
VNNTHQVAQTTAPECRIVYVDNDPFVLVHARALLTSTSEGVTNYLHADVRDPERIQHEAARTLDFTRPVGLMLLGISRSGLVNRLGVRGLEPPAPPRRAPSVPPY